MQNSRIDGPVGRVVGLWRYPVKSMGPEALEQVEVTWHGLSGDRRWAFVREGVPGSGFPWFTLRQRGDLAHFLPSFLEPDQPDASKTVVRSPAGTTYDVTDPALAAELAAGVPGASEDAAGVHVIKQDRGVFDTFPLSLITTQTIARLGEHVGEELVVQRFRPNLLIEGLCGGEFPEDEWVGRTLRIGGMRMRVDKRDGRCVVITIDPATGARNPDILKAVTKERDGCLGVYGSVVEPGRVALGEPVSIES